MGMVVHAFRPVHFKYLTVTHFLFRFHGKSALLPYCTMRGCFSAQHIKKIL